MVFWLPSPGLVIGSSTCSLSGCTWDSNFSRRALVCHCHEPLQLLSPQYESLNQWLGNNTRTPLCTEHTEGREKEPENRMLNQITEVCPAWGLKMSRVCGDRQPEVCLHEDRGASWEILKKIRIRTLWARSARHKV